MYESEETTIAGCEVRVQLSSRDTLGKERSRRSEMHGSKPHELLADAAQALTSPRPIHLSTSRAAAIMLSRAARPAFRAAAPATLRYVERAVLSFTPFRRRRQANIAIASAAQRPPLSPLSRARTMLPSERLRAASSLSATSRRSPRR